MKNKIFLCLIFFFFLPVSHVVAADSNNVSLVFPVRSPQYWRQGASLENFSHLYAAVRQTKLPSTWLLHYDVFDSTMAAALKQDSRIELGIFLEVTRKLAEDSYVKYDWPDGIWSRADKIFLSGYSPGDRRLLIDRAFSAFKASFGFYPQSYGAWYIDVWSMEYIKSKYHARVTLGLADQYSTDGYQEWGQYINQPYLVSKTSALEPAYTPTDSTQVLKLQWAPRDPLFGFGLAVSSSNYSAQVNDYHRGLGLSHDHFTRLLQDNTQHVSGKISHIVVGIEVGELEDRYFPELKRQLDTVRFLADRGGISVKTMSGFSDLYHTLFPYVSPPLAVGSVQGNLSQWWYFSPVYRIGFEISADTLSITDLRYYHHSEYRDNDQLQADFRRNLVRLTPAVIDKVVLKNPLIIQTGSQYQVTNLPGRLEIAWPGNQLIASASALFLPLPLASSAASLALPQATGPAGFRVFGFPEPAPVGATGCGSDYGHYSGKWPCLKHLVSRLSGLIPDLVYSDISGVKYLGLRLDPTHVFALTFPRVKIAKFDFPFPVLSNFISLKSAIRPRFEWQGKQELELLPYRNLGSVFPKGLLYGEDRLKQSSRSAKLYENSYYEVIKTP